MCLLSSSTPGHTGGRTGRRRVDNDSPPWAILGGVNLAGSSVNLTRPITGGRRQGEEIG